jgi:hypothetical protein
MTGNPRHTNTREGWTMMKAVNTDTGPIGSILLWLLAVPLPVLILIYLIAN